ncbi:hypothetical protein V6Z11_A09G053700 [Gossypium hirsutum]
MAFGSQATCASSFKVCNHCLNRKSVKAEK